MTAPSACERLSEDHRRLHEVLTQLLAALQHKDVKASYLKLDLLWARLAVHIRAEHLHLFPAVISRMADAETVVEKLRTDHDFFMRELASAVGILRQIPQPFDSPNEDARLNSVLEIVLEVEKRLAEHDTIEENQIYRWASEILTGTEQMELAGRINAELEHRPPRFSVEAWKNKPNKSN